MPAKGPGPTTSFENMTHEQMLTWLDQANSGQVQAAAERLLAAAKAIRDIAEELKIRPQWVAWKGEGADAFRTWTADLANSTLRLGDFSDDAAKWLTEASWAIARAQSSIPREVPGDVQTLQANVDAARAAHNDPDAATAATQAEQELQALTRRKEMARLQAAAQMRKLAQTYSWSAMQMSALERPKFPPPPQAVRPPESESFSTEISRPGAGASPSGALSSEVAATAGSAPVHGASTHAADATRTVGPKSLERATALDTAPAPSMSIDSLTTLPPQAPHAPTDAISGSPVPDQVRREAPTQPGLAAPAFGNNRGRTAVHGPGRAVTGSTEPVRAVTGSPRQGAPVTGPISPSGPGQTAAGRSPLLPGQSVPPTSSGRIPSGPANGIVGGRPVTPPAGRSQGAIPRGVVVGGEHAPARGPLGPVPGTANPAGRTMGQPRQVTGRSLPSPSSGIVGGRPLPFNGVVGDASQRPGHTGARTSAPGGPTTPVGNGAAHNGVTGGTTSTSRPGGSQVTGGSRAPQPTYSTNPGKRGGQRHQAAQDPETRQQTRQRNVPRVVD